jgi:putative ABC transport system permease protein
MNDVFRDLVFTLRTWRKAPGFAVVTVLTLALGIALTVTIFSAVNGVLLRPLPYAQPENLANIWVDLGVGNQSLPAVSPLDFRDYQQRAKTFDSFAAASGGNIVGAAGVVSGGGVEPERVTLSTVTANFFPLLGIQPVFGRHFDVNEEVFQGPPVVMLSHRLWRRRYGGDPALVGRTIELDGVPHAVVGVLPQDFRLLLPAEAFLVQDSEIWKPLQFNYTQAPPRNFTFYTVFGRLRPGVTFEQAQAEMTAIGQQLRAEHPVHESSDMRIRVVPLQDDVVKAARPALLALLGTVAFVLVIACANVAQLLLARGLGRELEVAVRTALGASRWRIVRQHVTESLLLALAGSVAGLLLASACLAVLRTMAPESLPRIDDIRIDGTVLAFTAAVGAATALLFGIAPAVHWGRVAPSQALKTASSSATAAQARIRNLLVIAEIALSVVLVVGAGLLIRSFIGLQQVQPGFQPERVLTFQLALPRVTYANADARRQFMRVLGERLRTLPGVESVGFVSQLPLTGSGPLSPYAYDESTARNWESATADGRVASPDYFTSMGTRLMAGRFFTSQERPNVIIIDETLAARAFPGRSAVGQQLQTGPTGSPNMYSEVVGVIEHMRILELGRPVRGLIFRPLFGQATFSVTVRTQGSPETLTGPVRETVRSLDPQLALDRVQPMTAYVGDALAQSRFSLLLMSIFGALAVVLAAIGMYGVISYSLMRRTREIGIRLALGEPPARVRNLILRQGLGLIALSLMIGLPIAVAVAWMLRDLLYQVTPTDGPTYAVAAVVLGFVGILSCFIPAYRASRIVPVLALRRD